MKKTLITGMPRSGTLWMFHALKRAGEPYGIEVSHESTQAKHIHVMPATISLVSPEKFHPENYEVVLHQYRNPLKVWQSMETLALKHRFVMFNSEWDDPEVYEAVYLRWWVRCELLAAWSYRVEDVYKGSAAWDQILKRIGFPEIVPFPEGGWNDNSRKYRPRYRPEPFDPPDKWFREFVREIGYVI